MKDMGEARYVTGIEIFHDKSQELLGLSQKTYINKVLTRFGMKNCSTNVVPIQKGDKFCFNQCPKNELEHRQMKNILYVWIVGNLMYAQTCTWPDISFVVCMLGRYKSNLELDHWKFAKKVLRYIKDTKDIILTYRKSHHFEAIEYSDSNYARCIDIKKSTFGYPFLLVENLKVCKLVCHYYVHYER